MSRLSPDKSVRLREDALAVLTGVMNIWSESALAIPMNLSGLELVRFVLFKSAGKVLESDLKRNWLF